MNGLVLGYFDEDGKGKASVGELVGFIDGDGEGKVDGVGLIGIDECMAVSLVSFCEGSTDCSEGFIEGLSNVAI